MEQKILTKCLDKKVKADGILALGLLAKHDKAMTALEIQKSGIDISRSDLRQLVRLGLITKRTHYLRNSRKVYQNKENKLIQIKGTKVYKYKFKHVA